MNLPANAVTIDHKQGSTMGTTIVKILSDPGNIVRDVNFYVTVLNGSAETGPYPADIVRRHDVGTYEKDIVLSTEAPTDVRVEIVLEDGSLVSPAPAVQHFGERVEDVFSTGGGPYLPFSGGQVVGTLGVGSTLEFSHNAHITARNSAGGLDFFMTPRAIDNNTYLNLGSGGILLLRDQANTEVARVHTAGITVQGDRAISTSGGVFYGDRTLNWANNIPDGSGQLILRSQADTRKRTVLGYSDGGAGPGFGFIAAGQYAVAWTPLLLQPSGGSVMIGGVGAAPASGLHVYGDRYATFGPNTTWGQFLKVGSGPRPDDSASMFATDGNLHVDSKSTGFLFLNYYSGTNVVVGANTEPPPSKFNVYGDAHIAGSVRVAGNNPLYFPAWEGGWYMQDGNWIRALNNKGILTAGAIRGGDFTADAGASTTWGGARLYNGTEWGGTAFPTLGSTAGGGLIMLRRPHVPFHTDGAFMRFATDGPATAFWDTGVYSGDRWVVGRLGYAHLTGFNNGGFRFSYFAQAGDTGVVDIGSMSATNWFRSTGSTGWLNQTYLGGWYMADATYVRSYGDKSVYTGGSFYSGAGFRVAGAPGLTWDNGAALHGSAAYLMSRTDMGIQLQTRAGATRGYVYFDGDGFGLVNGANQWAVRANPGTVALHGNVSTTGNFLVPAASRADLPDEIYNGRGHRVAAIVFGPTQPTNVAPGTLWIQT